MKLHKLIIFLFLLTSFSLKAKCHKVLKSAILKRLGVKQTYLIGSEAELNFLEREAALSNSLKKYGKKEDILANKIDGFDELIRETLLSEDLESGIHDVLSKVYLSINDPKYLKKWLIDLYKDAVTQVYIEGTQNQILEFEISKMLPKDIVIDLLLERSKAGGFSGARNSIITLYDPLLDNEFGDLLFDKKLILDITFVNKRHGDMIHMFHVDLMIQVLKDHGIDPVKAGEFYQWMGTMRTSSIATIENPDFDPNTEFWVGLFDSFENEDFSNPVILNPIIQKTFMFLK